jgi:hypothetical protein
LYKGSLKNIEADTLGVGTGGGRGGWGGVGEGG